MSYLDQYCERVGSGLLAEPANLLSNAAFVLAAWLVWRAWRRSGLGLRRGGDLLLLLALIAIIGIGSGIWHAFATSWALWLDVLPILLFINVYLLAALRRGLDWHWRAVAAGWIVFQLVNQGVAVSLPPTTLNGSVFYLPTGLCLVLLAWAHRRHAPALAQALWQGVAIFGVSLTLRSIDNALCTSWPLGTHFAWHLLNAWLLGRLTLALIAHASPHHQASRSPTGAEA
ncbi:ceramidase domain-containing protein [Jeongeupia wiesaeckerbachi]|uniref:ceramidase domain-containing protein n=1 Tax=Jeongeupia wiesaeckerbachi TaxID=3051218 RepID=UPI003D8084E2